MIVCFDCFKESPPVNDWPFYNRREVVYVMLTDTETECEVCKQKKHVIKQAIAKLMNPFGKNPPEGWIPVPQDNPPVA